MWWLLGALVLGIVVLAVVLRIQSRRTGLRGPVSLDSETSAGINPESPGRSEGYSFTNINRTLDGP